MFTIIIAVMTIIEMSMTINMVTLMIMVKAIKIILIMNICNEGDEGEIVRNSLIPNGHRQIILEWF